jgi:hypothetical protein
MPRYEDEDEPRPPRSRRDEDPDEPRRGDVVAKGPLDNMFANTNIVVLVLFGICCSGIALILGIIALATGRDERAKSNALIVTIIGGILTVLYLIAQFTGMLAFGK